MQDKRRLESLHDNGKREAIPNEIWWDMRRRNTQPRPQGDRDWDILEHIMRYRMTTREALHQLFFDDSQSNAVTKVTTRLVDAGFLNAYEFRRTAAAGVPRKYFVLGLNGTKAFGVTKRRSQPLGKQAIVEDYGTLAFCCLGKRQRERMTVRELQLFDSELVKGKLATGPYFREQFEGADTLTFIRVDYGSTIDNLLRKCESDIRQRMAQPAFRELILNGQFHIAIVTTDRGEGERAERIRQSLSRREWPIRFRVAAVTGLFELW